MPLPNFSIRVGTLNDFKAYLFQILYSELLISEKVYSALFGTVIKDDLVLQRVLSLDEENIKNVLRQYDLVPPNERFIFNFLSLSPKELEILNSHDELTKEKLLIYPTIFTSINQLNFIGNGLFVGEHFNLQFRSLNSFDGKTFLKGYQDIDLTMENGVIYQDLDDSGWWFGKVIENKLEIIQGPTGYEELETPLELGNRDKDVALFYYQDIEGQAEWQQLNNLPQNLNLLAETEIIDLIRDDSIWTCHPDLVNQFKGNKLLALEAIKQEPTAIEYLDEKLQNDGDVQRAFTNTIEGIETQIEQNESLNNEEKDLPF